MTGRNKVRWTGALIVAGALLAGAGIVPAAAANSVSTTYAWGYQKAPNYYDISQGPAAGNFDFTVTNLTSSPIDTTVEFIADRIISVQGTDVTAGYPAYSEAYLGANFSQTVQQYYVLYQTQALNLGANASQTLSFSFTLSKCGYYQFDSDAVHNSVPGLFATGFTRVIGCGPDIATTPSPQSGPVGTVTSDSATLTGGANPTGTVTFSLFGPGDTTCSGANLVASLSGFSNVPLSGGGASSAGYTTTQAGTYNWVASYSGDVSNPSVTSPCGAEAVTITKPLGEQGCTPGFWKNSRHYGLWEVYTPTQSVGSVFTVPSTFPDGSDGASLSSSTLAGALAFAGGSSLNGAAQILLRAAAAGLLNSTSSGVAYSLATSQIISSVDTALSSGSRSEMLDLATAIDSANNGMGGCPLS